MLLAKIRRVDLVVSNIVLCRELAVLLSLLWVVLHVHIDFAAERQVVTTWPCRP